MHLARRRSQPPSAHQEIALAGPRRDQMHVGRFSRRVGSVHPCDGRTTRHHACCLYHPRARMHERALRAWCLDWPVPMMRETLLFFQRGCRDCLEGEEWGKWHCTCPLPRASDVEVMEEEYEDDEEYEMKYTNGKRKKKRKKMRSRMKGSGHRPCGCASSNSRRTSALR